MSYVCLHERIKLSPAVWDFQVTSHTLHS